MQKMNVIRQRVSKVMRPTHDYSLPITDKLDGANFASWSGSAQLTVTGSGTVGYIDGKKTAPRADGDAYSMWEEENRCSCLGLGVKKLQE
ncbi:Pentatricopeptide repeat superfamily protein, partial [Prunus dulcis]